MEDCWSERLPHAIRMQVAGLILIDPLSPSDWADTVAVHNRGCWAGASCFLGAARCSPALVWSVSRWRCFPPAAGLSRNSSRAPSSGSGESVISRLVGEVQKMPPDVWPMIQALGPGLRAFEALAEYLRSLPDVSRETAALELPASIPLIILSAKNSTPSQIAERDESRASIHRRPPSRHETPATGFIWTNPKSSLMRFKKCSTHSRKE